MGGVAGHMDHLYDNPDLTFGKMKEILQAAADGELETEEKVDGQNIFLSYSLKDKEHIYIPSEGTNARAARNKGNLLNAGMDATELAEKFAGHSSPGIKNAFVNSFKAFEKAVGALSPKEKLKIFGPDTNIWYNAEVMDPGTETEDGIKDPDDPGAVNVIKYDGKTIKIHNVGHFSFDRKTGEKHPIPDGSLETLDAAFDRMQEKLSGDKFSLARKAIIQLQKMESNEVLSSTLSRINQQITNENLSDSSTMQEYVYSRLQNGLDSDLPDRLKDEIVKYLMELPGNIGLRELKKNVSPENLKDLVDIINNKRMLLQQAIEPLELAIHDFAVELLKGLKSVFIANTDKEVERLRHNLSIAVKEMTAGGFEDPQKMVIMQKHLNKIKDFSQVNTPVEAVVFDYDGHTYKFSGNFAPLNQILGMYKYGRIKGKTPPNPSKSNPGEVPTSEGFLSFASDLIQEQEEGNIKREKARQFVLSLPKFTPSEAWGKPGSMERKQIQKIFDTVGGGATIQEKLQFLNDSIENPRGGITSPTRIISTLILMESLASVIRSFNSASAGFVFEGFLAALFRGTQVAEISEKGNLPIQDLIAFSEIEGGNPVPISLKLLNQTTNIEGSYTNLVDSLDEFGQMVYIVARKDVDRIALEKFTFTRDNFINALITSSKGGTTKEAALFTLPPTVARTTDNSIKRLNKLKGDDNWPKKYQLLQLTKGYRNRKKKAAPPEETVTVTDEMPDGEDVAPQQLVARRLYTVEENRRLLAEESLTESYGGTQWAISPQQLKSISGKIDYETMGTLPISSERIIDVAEQYMDNLSDTLANIFEATSKLSENVNDYFTYQDRSQAITAGQKAIEKSKVVADEMSQQISQDSNAPGQRNEGIEHLAENQPKRVALFPGKFKPPHKGHYEFVNKIAKRNDVDEVLVLISPVDKGPVSADHSLSIWSKFLKSPDAASNINVEIADYRSPVTTVYEFLADPTKTRKGDTTLLIKSSKDEGDARFANAKSYAEKHNPGISVEEIEEDPVSSEEGLVYSAEDLRDMINANDKDKFLTYMPDNVNGEDIWSIFRPNETLKKEVDSMIGEMSSMGGGDVAGYAGGFGPPNQYNPYDRTKKRQAKKPKLKRAKRQRRR